MLTLPNRRISLLKKSYTENDPSFDDDLDDINAKLRDAYEWRDKNTF